MKYLAIIAAFLLTGCGKFSDGTSIWQGGLWIIPTVTQLAALWFLYVALRAQKSGSYKINEAGFVTKEDGGKMPIYQIGQFWFFVGFQLATIGIIIWQNLEK